MVPPPIGVQADKRSPLGYAALVGGSRMDSFDPKLLRRLANRYLERAKSEPDKARIFLEIAKDMEAHADNQERR
jgi:hypothetical protein